tara:strand:+ start:41943 stop:43145 length:1203 start_codon:yes stop_codon:yes gene_type:complete
MKDHSPIILFHHRKPTSTKNTLHTTHPIFVRHEELDYDYYISHNGVITNHGYLKQEHNKKGYEYTTEFREETILKYKNGKEEESTTGAVQYNDSEALAVETARYIDGQGKAPDFRGAAAVWGIKVDKKSQKVLDIFFFRNEGRELGVERTKKWVSVYSEAPQQVGYNILFHINPKTRKDSQETIDLNKYYGTTNFSNTANTRGVKGGRQESPATPALIPGMAEYLPSKAEKTQKLVNAYYTSEQIQASGFPFKDFTRAHVKQPDGSIMVMYFPDVFGGQNVDNRPTLMEYNYQKAKEGKVFEINEPPTTNEWDSLMQFSYEYAKHMKEYIELEEECANGTMNLEEYNIQSTTIEAECRVLEDKMSTLGFSQEEVDNAIMDAEDFIDNNGNLSEEEINKAF